MTDPDSPVGETHDIVPPPRLPDDDGRLPCPIHPDALVGEHETCPRCEAESAAESADDWDEHAGTHEIPDPDDQDDDAPDNGEENQVSS